MPHNYNLSELLGHSVSSKDYIEFAANFNFITKDKIEYDYQNNIWSAEMRDNDNGIFLEFYGHKRYKSIFGEPEFIKDPKVDELILKEITVDNLYSEKKKLPDVKLPFDICFGDDKETLINKFKKGPYERRFGSSYSFAWWFQFDNFRLLTALDQDYKLIWVRFIRLTIDEKEKIKVKKDLAQQKKNINPYNANSILEYSKKLPTIEWKKRKDEGDEIFTDKAISDAENILTNYLESIAEFTKAKKASNIYNSIKKVVSALNKINDKNNGFIDTMEREELCDFINAIVRMTGLKIDASIDLTEQWREW